MSVRLLNATSSGEQLTFQEPAEDLAAFDALPPALQRQVDGNNTKMAASWALDQLRRARRIGMSPDEAVASVCRKILLTESYEIAVFAGEFRGKYGTALPHVAADASIQRYGARGPSRHPPARCGKPVIRRGKGRRR